MSIPYAFPVSWPEPNAPEPGMTLRDWFAGQALPALITGRDWSGIPDDQSKVDAWAAAAYIVADAMLAERERRS
jgi:hypothetical protein